MTESIAKAVEVFRKHPNASYAQTVAYLTQAVGDEELAERLMEFVPLAYTHVGFANSGVEFDERFCRSIGNGKFSQFFPLQAEPLWNVAMAYAKQEMDHGMTVEDWYPVACRSASFDSINKACSTQTNLHGAVSSPTFFLRQAPMPINNTTLGWWQKVRTYLFPAK